MTYNRPPRCLRTFWLTLVVYRNVNISQVVLTKTWTCQNPGISDIHVYKYYVSILSLHMIINLNMSINHIFSITHRLIFRYFIHEHLHLLKNSLYIHMDIVTLEYLHIHVSPSSLCLHIYSFHVFFA